MWCFELNGPVNIIYRTYRSLERYGKVFLLASSFILCILYETTLHAQQSEEWQSQEEEDSQDHEGFITRATLGIGYGLYSGKGKADPIPGVELIKDPSHDGPALNLSFDVGHGIIDNLALHVGVYFETILTSNDESDISTFYLIGLGGGATYYIMPYDIYVTGQIRWVGALVYIPNAPCATLQTSKFEGFDGIGLSLSFGKEWFDEEDHTGFGIGLQANYAYLGDRPTFHYFSIMLVPTLTSF